MNSSHTVGSTVHLSLSLDDLQNLRSRLDRARGTIMLLNEASLTERSTLALEIATRLQRHYNVIVLFVAEGDLVQEFGNCCATIIAPAVGRNYADADRLVKSLLIPLSIDYAIVINPESGIIVRALTTAFIPVVTLFHEYNARSLGATGDALSWSPCVVFTDSVAAEAAKREHPTLLEQRACILPLETSDLFDVGETTPRAAQTARNMDRCVVWLDQRGRETMAVLRQRMDDFITLRDNSLFDRKVFLPPNSTIAAREEAIIAFLARWTATGGNRLPNTNFFLRRPCPGFHPQIYAHENAQRYDTRTINPLAHLIRGGCRHGPWRHDVILPAIPERAPGLRAAIHGHFFYPELAADFFERLACNRAPCDLWLTTDDDAKATMLREAARSYGVGKVEIRLVPNCGRDIGAFLTAIVTELEPHYDVVGHIHGKRSTLTTVGEQWRQFLWQNLIGSLHPMMDVILDRFEADASLGLVFPDDPHLPDWDANREIASQLALRMGIEVPLPPYFNFPVGTMFWVRPHALKPLLDLKLGWHDYPKEPLAKDGTILHALERLMPFVVRHMGYRYASTHIPEVSWNGGQGTNYDLECDRTMKSPL